MDGQKRTGLELLGYDTIGFDDITKVWPELANTRADVKEQVEIEGLYHGYLERQQLDIELFKKDEDVTLPKDIDYSKVGSLSNEMRHKLSFAKPVSVGAASRIPGVTPAAIMAILTYIKRHHLANNVSRETFLNDLIDRFPLAGKTKMTIDRSYASCSPSSG